MPSAEKIGLALRASPVRVRRLLKEFRKRGLTRLVPAIKAGVLAGDVEAICNVGTRWNDPSRQDAFEAELRDDPSVAEDAKIAGRFDYRIRSFHADAAAGHAWHERIKALPLAHADVRWRIPAACARRAYAAPAPWTNETGGG